MSKKYLLDTNICIFMLQDKFGVADHLRRVGRRNCYVSEPTIAELLYGYAYCQDPRNELVARSQKWPLRHDDIHLL